jgi:tetratricopeptide (TPR) repeat protein
VLVVLLGLIAPIVLSFVERERPAANRAFELEYLPKGEYLRIAALGYRQVIADLIWLKAVYHFGERKQTKAGYRWVYHAVDVLTDLDPKFAMAYYAAGTILGVWSGQINESIAILEKGMRHNSDMWQLPFVIGYDYYYELCDPVRAAGYFRQASLLPGAPDYLPRLAARMTVEGGEPEAALEFLERMAEQTKDERMRDALKERVREVLSERDIRFLEEAIRRYTAQHGRRPRSLADLVQGDIINEVPRSPFGQPYVLDRSSGRVSDPGLRERLQVHRHVDCRTVTRSAPAQGPGLIRPSVPDGR